MAPPSGWSAAIALCVLFLVSGCSDSGRVAQAPESSPGTGPADGTGAAGFGAIEGLIVDEEELPIANVTVALSGTNLTTSTTPGGRFSIPDVAAGGHTLMAERLGYARFSGPVDVVAGNTTQVTVQMLMVCICDGAAIDTEPHEGYIECSFNPYFAVNPCGDLVSNSIQNFRVTPGTSDALKEIILELVWEPGTAATGQDLELDFCPLQEGPSQGTVMCVEYYGFTHGASPQKLRIPAAALPYPDIVDYEAWVGAGYQSPYPVVKQNFDLWVSLCYVQNCPPDFSALPPG